jgi:hypothetical protein
MGQLGLPMGRALQPGNSSAGSNQRGVDHAKKLTWRRLREVRASVVGVVVMALDEPCSDEQTGSRSAGQAFSGCAS